MLEGVFLQFGVIIVTAAVFAFIAHRIKQPLIIAYIFTGLFVGPGVFGFMNDLEMMHILSEIGIAFLLFLVGVNLNWRNIKEVGWVSLVSGIGQAGITSAIGYGVGLWLGFDVMTSLFLAMSFAFSSTIVVVKMLSDKRDLDRLYARISIGILIVQDLIAMVMLLVLGAMGEDMEIGALLTDSFVKVIASVFVLWVIARFVLPYVFKYAAKSHELLFLTSIGWCFAVAGALSLLGFGMEIGALLAGISLAGTGFQREIESKVKPLRDFFLVIFFIMLGLNLSLDALVSVIFPALVFSAFVIIASPLVVILLLRMMGYHPRTGFLTGTSISQISEFSFIVVAAGISSGILDQDILTLVTLVGIITIAISSYFIIYNERIYEFIEPLLEFFAPNKPKMDRRPGRTPSVMLFGYRDMGAAILPAIKRLKHDYLVVDFDPAMIDSLHASHIPAIYGDAGNEELLAYVSAERTKLIISTIPDVSVNSDILRYMRHMKSRSTVIVTARSKRQSRELYNLGASFVIVTSSLGGAHFANLLSRQKIAKRSWNAVTKKEKGNL